MSSADRQLTLASLGGNIVDMKWFSRLGWFYLPASFAGGMLCILAALFCVTVFRAIDMYSHLVSDTLYGVFPFFACTFLLLDWLARRTSGDAVQ